MFNLPKIEEAVLEFWRRDKTFQKSLDKDSPQGDYVFYDGPPFATGLPHYGHILGSTLKDMVGRYQTMRGYHVARRWGWDTHGLPIENIVEKKLGINSKKEIESYGVAKFNEASRAQVLEYVKEWGKTVERVGRWVDFENSYKTMDNSYIESVWWAFKEIYQKGLIYEGKKVLLNCPRCETPIAKAEVAMDNSYKDITEDAVYVKFKVKDEANTYLLAWTTTPWTLPGNVALAVGKDIAYSKIKKGDEYYFLAKDRLDAIEGGYELVEELTGQALLELAYEPLYTIEEVVGGAGPVHQVVAADFVTTEEGTGIVHTAVVYGDDDYELGVKLGLPVIPLLNERAIFGDKVPGFLQGAYFKDADELVVQDLKDRELLIKVESNTHSYPHCHRCETPLFYNAIDAWFINIQKIKPRLLELNEQLSWYPGHIKHGRFKKSVEAAPDWNISRNRYWASTIPVWKCQSAKCDQLEVVGSLAELREKATNPPAGDIDLHKHVVDEIELKCVKCGEAMRRVPEVMDCWVESGSMPFAAVHYPFENQDWFKQNFPAQFIGEYTGQVRTWFYYMLVLSTCLFDRIPFEHVAVTGTILAEDGTKMSKSKQNFPDPWKIFDKYGVDALRLYLLSNRVMNAEDINFSEEAIKEKVRTFITLMNVVSFYQMFADGEDVQNLEEKDLTNVLDIWITARLNDLIKDVTERLDNYDITGSARRLEEFINDLSVWYVRRSRDRFKSSNNKIKLPALSTLRHVLFNVARLMAPFTPFVADHIYTNELQGMGGSVHLRPWPEVEHEKVIGQDVLPKMKLVRGIVEAGLAKRAEVKMPVRQPLASAQVTGNNLQLTNDYSDLIKAELNVKDISFSQKSEVNGQLSVTLDTNITEELRLEGLKREIIRGINNLRKKQGLTIQDRVKLGISADSDDIKKVIDQYGDDILQATIASEFVAVSAEASAKEEGKDGEEIKLGDSTAKITLTK